MGLSLGRSNKKKARQAVDDLVNRKGIFSLVQLPHADAPKEDASWYRTGQLSFALKQLGLWMCGPATQGQSEGFSALTSRQATPSRQFETSSIQRPRSWSATSLLYNWGLLYPNLLCQHLHNALVHWCHVSPENSKKKGVRILFPAPKKRIRAHISVGFTQICRFPYKYILRNHFLFAGPKKGIQKTLHRHVPSGCVKRIGVQPIQNVRSGTYVPRTCVLKYRPGELSLYKHWYAPVS